MSHNNIFYVYCYNDITTGVPCYIGKGHTKKGYNRSKVKHTHNTNVHAMEKEQGITIIMLKEHLSEVDAFLWEMHYIKEIGRLDLGTGPLLNQTDGGDGAAGHRQTPEAKEKQSKAMMGEKNPFFGKTHTPEFKEKQSKAMTGRIVSPETKEKQSKAMTGEKNPCYGRTGEKNPFFGKTHTPEAKEKQSKAMTGRIVSPETKEKQSKAMMGEKNPFFGKTHTLEAKKKMGHPGEKHPFFGKTHTPEAKEKQSKAVAGEKNPNYGKTHTSDAKKKMGIAQKESWRLKKLAQANALTKEFFF